MLYGRKNPLSKKQQDTRLKQHSVTGYKRWVDPFPWIHGTLPEKIVYAALSARGVRFYFLNDIATNIPELDIYKEYQADFILPDHKIIIEVQGAYWHSKPETQAADAYKFALYEITGYKPLAWWDFEIIQNIHQLFLRDLPQFASSMHLTQASELAPMKRTKIDTSQGIRTLNTRRAQRVAYRKKPIRYTKRRRSAGNSYSINV